MRRLLAYAQLVRLPNTFTAMADIFLAAIAAGQVHQLSVCEKSSHAFAKIS